MKTYHLQKRTPLPISNQHSQQIQFTLTPLHPLPTNIKLPKPKFPQSLPQKTHPTVGSVFILSSSQHLIQNWLLLLINNKYQVSIASITIQARPATCAGRWQKLLCALFSS